MSDEGFDFQEITEEPQEHDFERMVPCPHCRKPIPQDSTLCYYCGKDTTVVKKPLWVVWAAIITVIAFGLFMAAR
jgi:RNA polymerase subunit RPABC4/transcription elongation factor Spt4